MAKEHTRNRELFCKITDEMNERNVSHEERNAVYIGLIAGSLATIADVLLESKRGETDGNS